MRAVGAVSAAPGVARAVGGARGWRARVDGPGPVAAGTAPRRVAWRPLRVLLVRHGPYPEDPRVRREALALRDAGHEVAVLCLREPGQAAREVVEGVAVRRLPVRHRRRGAARYAAEYAAFALMATARVTWAAARGRLAGCPIDVVQVHSMPDALVFCSAAARALGSQVVLDLHEVMPELYASKFGVGLGHPLPRALAAVEQAAIRFADASLAVSAPVLERYVARGAPRDAFTVVMNAPDPRWFHRGWRADPRPPGPPRIVSHGTLVERHGFDVLIHALADVPGALLEVVGEGEARPDLERLAADLGLAGRVTFAGRVPLERVAARVAAADIGVVANRSDPFTDLVVPTKLLEYAALGVPAVVARTPAVEAYFPPDAVRYVAPGDPASLAAALRALVVDSAERSRLAAAAGRALGPIAWPAMAARYVARVEAAAGIAGRGEGA